jgi:hypothetical protein
MKYGAFYIETKGETLNFVYPVILFGKGNANRPVFSLSVNLFELTQFKVLKSKSELNIFREKYIDKNIEFLAKANFGNTQFMTKPGPRPKYLDLGGSSHEVNVYLSGAGFSWLIAVQPQYLEQLMDCELQVSQMRCSSKKAA